MNNFSIIVDTTSDLNREILKDFDIKLIKAHFVDKDGQDKFAFTSWDECDYYRDQEEFFENLKDNPDLYKTSANNVFEVSEFLKNEVKDGKDVLCITISSAISGTYNIYQNAILEVKEIYPNCNIKLVDSLRFGCGIGLMAIWASIKRSENYSIEDTVKFLEKEKNTFHQMGWLDDLSFVAKKGRIGHGAAFFGTLIGIKPLGEFNKNGMTSVIGKAKGEKNAFETMIKYIKNTIVNPNEQVLLICHSSRSKQALIYKELIQKFIQPKEIYVIECGPSCGINVGPGLMSCYYKGKQLSDELIEESLLINKILKKEL